MIKKCSGFEFWLALHANFYTSRRGGRDIAKANGSGLGCQFVTSVFDRKAALSKSQQYGSLSKTQMMATPVDKPT